MVCANPLGYLLHLEVASSHRKCSGSPPATLPAFVVMCHVLDPDMFQIATCQPRLLLPGSFPLALLKSPSVHLPETLEIFPPNAVIHIAPPKICFKKMLFGSLETFGMKKTAALLLKG